MAVRPDRGSQHRRSASAAAPGESFGPERELPFRTFGDVSADLVVSAGGRAVAVSTGSDGTLDWWRGDVGSTMALTGLPALGAGERIDPAAGSGPGGDQRGRRRPVHLDRPRRPTPRGLDRRRPRRQRARIAAGVANRAAGARVAVGDARRGVMAWIADGRVFASARGLDGTISPGHRDLRLAGCRSATRPPIAMDSSGAAIVFWTRIVGRTPVVERATAAPSLTSRPARNG